MLKDYLYETVKKQILNIDTTKVKDIYVLYLHIANIDDDLRKPTVSLGYNTLKQVKNSLKDAFDSLDAKWNIAYFLDDILVTIGENNEEQEMIYNWINENNLYYTDQKLEQNYERAIKLGEQITDLFIKLLIEIVQKFQDENVIIDKFSKKIPILINLFGTFDDLKEINQAANAKDLINEYVEWIENY